MRQVRAACRFRQFQKVTGIDFSIFDIRRSIVGIAHRESDESQTQSEQKGRAWMSELELGELLQQRIISIEMMINGKLSQPRTQRIRTKYEHQNHEIDRAYFQEEPSFEAVTVVKLTKSGDQR